MIRSTPLQEGGATPGLDDIWPRENDIRPCEPAKDRKKDDPRARDGTSALGSS